MKRVKMLSIALLLSFLLFAAHPMQPVSAQWWGGGLITIGTTVNDRLTNSEGDRWYFEAAEGDLVMVSVFSADAIDTYIELYDADDQLLTSDDDSGGNSNPLISGFEIPADGTYTILIRGYDGARGEYSLTFDVGSLGGSGFEGTYDMGEIAIGGTSSTILISEAGDSYNFDGTMDSTVSLWVVGDSLDTVLELYGPDGELLTSDDDSGGSGNPSINGYMLPESGTYTIIVRGYNGTTGSYTLYTSGGRADGGGGSTGGDGSCSPDSYQMGILSWETPISSFTIYEEGDAYYFDGTAGQHVYITMTGEDGYDTYLELYNASCQQIDHDDDSAGNGSAQLSVTLPSTGRYWVIARGYNGVTGAYSLVMSASEPQGQMDNTGSGEGCAPDAYAMGALVPEQVFNSFTISEDGDAYTFTSDSYGRRVMITATGYDGFDTYVELYDTNCNLIGYDDDSGGNGNASLIADLTSAGTYTAVVRGFNGGTGTYDIVLSFYQGNH